MYYIDVTGKEFEELLYKGGSGGGGSSENSGIVSILDFGGVGDGSTNDTDALKEAAASGEVVYFPEGTYLLYEQIDMSADIHWYGDGEGTIIKMMPYDQSRPEVYGGRTVYNSYMITQSKDDGADGYSIYLRDLILDANKSGYKEDILNNGSSKYDHVTCIDLYEPKDVYMHHVIIRNALIEGMYMYAPSGTVLISDCQFIGNGYYKEDASGLHMEGDLSNVVLSNSIFQENGFHGLLVSGKNLKASNLSCCDNGYDGVCLWGGASHNMITNVYCGNNRGGVHVKAKYSPNSEDYINESWMTYADGNIITGLTTHKNTYGFMFGLSKNTLINGWMSDDDQFSFYYSRNTKDNVDEYTTEDVTGCISNAVFNPVISKASKSPGLDLTQFKIMEISSSVLAANEDDFGETILLELGSIDSSTGENKESSDEVRITTLYPVTGGTSIQMENSEAVKMRLFFYDVEQSFITGWNQGYNYRWLENGEYLTVPDNAAYMRFYMQTTNTNTTVSITPYVR